MPKVDFYKARKIDVCTIPVRNEDVCPYCTDKEICKVPNAQFAQVFLQKTQ